MHKVAKHRVHSARSKARVRMKSVRGTKTINKMGQLYGIHPAMLVGHAAN